MTQKMTAAEALERATRGITDLSMPLLFDDFEDQWEQPVASLRKLGFVIIPIEPPDEVIERMAAVLFPDWFKPPTGPSLVDPDQFPGQTDRYRERGRKLARAAYAAIVTAPSNGEKE